jgi:hypothetical protein
MLVMAVDEELEEVEVVVVGLPVLLVVVVLVVDPTDVVEVVEEVVLLVDTLPTAESWPACSATTMAAPGSLPMMTLQIGELAAGHVKSWVLR